MGDDPGLNIEQALSHHHEVLALRVDVYTSASPLQMPFSQAELERSYSQHNHRNIPFEDCGYTSQRQFLTTVPSFARTTMPNDDFYIALPFEEEADLKQIVSEMENPSMKNPVTKKGIMRIVPRTRRASMANKDGTAPIRWPAPTYHMTINEIMFWKTKATMLSILVRFPDCTANAKDLNYHFVQATNVHLIPEMLCGMNWNDFFNRLKDSPNPILSEWNHGIWLLKFVKGTHVVEIPHNWYNDVMTVVATKIQDGKRYIASLVEMNGGRMSYDDFSKKYEANTLTPLDYWQRMRLIGCSGKRQFCQKLNEDNEMMCTERSVVDGTWTFITRTSPHRVGGKRKAEDAMDMRTKKMREECRRISEHAQCMYQAAMAIHKPFTGDTFLEFYRKLMEKRDAPEYVRDIPLKILDIPSIDVLLEKMGGMVRLDIDGQVFFTYIKDEEIEEDVESSDEVEDHRDLSPRTVLTNTNANTLPAISSDLSYQDLLLLWIKSFIYENLKGHSERALGKLCKLFEAEATFTIFAETFAMEPDKVLDMDWNAFIEKLKEPPLEVQVVLKSWGKNSTGWVVQNRGRRLPDGRGRRAWMDSILFLIRVKQQKGRAIIYQLIDGNEGRATFQELASLYEQKYNKKLNRHERYLLMGNTGINQFCRLLGFNCYPQRNVDLKRTPQETRLVFERDGTYSIQTDIFRDSLAVMKELVATVANTVKFVVVKQEVEEEVEDVIHANECPEVDDEALLETVDEQMEDKVVTSSSESESDAPLRSEAATDGDFTGVDQNENKMGKKKKRKNRRQRRKQRVNWDIDLSTIPLPPPPTPPDLTAVSDVSQKEKPVDDGGRKEPTFRLIPIDVSPKEIHVQDEVRAEPMVIASSSSDEHHKYDEEKEQKTQAIMRKMFKEQQLKKLYTLPLPPPPPDLSSAYDAVLEEHLEERPLTEPVDMEMATPVTSAESLTEEPQVIDSVADNVAVIASPESETEKINEEEIYPVVVSGPEIPYSQVNQEETKEDSTTAINLDYSLEDGEIRDSDTDLAVFIVRKEYVEKEHALSVISVSSASLDKDDVIRENIVVTPEETLLRGDSYVKEDEILNTSSEAGDEYLEEDVSSELPVEETISVVAEVELTASLNSSDEVTPESQAIADMEKMEVEEVVFKLLADLASEEAAQEEVPATLTDETIIGSGHDQDHVSIEEDKNEPEEHNPSAIPEVEQALEKDEVQEHPMEISNVSTVPVEVRAASIELPKEKEATDFDMDLQKDVVGVRMDVDMPIADEETKEMDVSTPVESPPLVAGAVRQDRPLLERRFLADLVTAMDNVISMFALNNLDVDMPMDASDIANKETNDEEEREAVVSDEKCNLELVEVHDPVDSEHVVAPIDGTQVDLEKKEPAPAEHLQEKEGTEEIAMEVDSPAVSTEINNALEPPLETDEIQISHVPTPVKGEGSGAADVLEEKEVIGAVMEVTEVPKGALDVDMPSAVSDIANKYTNDEEETKQVVYRPHSDKEKTERVEGQELVDSEHIDADVLDLEKEEPAPAEHLQEKEATEEIAMDVDSSAASTEIANKDTTADEETKEMDVSALVESPLAAGAVHQDRPLLERRFLPDLVTAINNFISMFSSNSLDVSVDQPEDRRLEPILEEEEEDYDVEMDTDEEIINTVDPIVMNSINLSKITIGKHLANDLLKAVDNIISKYSNMSVTEDELRQGDGEPMESEEPEDNNGTEIKQESAEEEHNEQNDNAEPLAGNQGQPAVSIEPVAVLVGYENEYHENIVESVEVESVQNSSALAPVEAVVEEDEHHEELPSVRLEESSPRSFEQCVVVVEEEPVDSVELVALLDGADLLETDDKMEVDITIQSLVDNVERSESVAKLLDELVTEVEAREKEAGDSEDLDVTVKMVEGEVMETDSKEDEEIPATCDTVPIIEETPKSSIRLGRRLSNDFIKAVENVISKYLSESLDSSLDRSQDLDGIPFSDDDDEEELEEDEVMGPDSEDEVEEEMSDSLGEDSIAPPIPGRINRLGFYIQLERHLLGDLVMAVDRIIAKYSTQADQQQEQQPVAVAGGQQEHVSAEEAEEIPVVVSHEGNEEEESVEADGSEGEKNIEAVMESDSGVDGVVEGVGGEEERMETDSHGKEETGDERKEDELMEEESDEDIDHVAPVAEKVHHEVRAEFELLPRRFLADLLKAVDNIISKYSNKKVVLGDELRQEDDKTMEFEESESADNNGPEIEQEDDSEQNDNSEQLARNQVQMEPVAVLGGEVEHHENIEECERVEDESVLTFVPFDAVVQEDEHHEELPNMGPEEGSLSKAATDSEQFVAEPIVSEEPLDELVAHVDGADLPVLETAEVEITIQSLVDNVERSESVAELLGELVTDVETRYRVRTITTLMHDHDYVLPPEEAAVSETVKELLDELVASVDKAEKIRLRTLCAIALDHDYMPLFGKDDSDWEMVSSFEWDETDEVEEEETDAEEEAVVTISHGLKRKAPAEEEEESERPVEKKKRAEPEGENEEAVIPAAANGEGEDDRHGEEGGSASDNVETASSAVQTGAEVDAQDNTNENDKTSKYTEYGNMFATALEEAERNGEDVEAIIRRTFEALHRRG